MYDKLQLVARQTEVCRTDFAGSASRRRRVALFLVLRGGSWNKLTIYPASDAGSADILSADLSLPQGIRTKPTLLAERLQTGCLRSQR